MAGPKIGPGGIFGGQKPSPRTCRWTLGSAESPKELLGTARQQPPSDFPLALAVVRRTISQQSTANHPHSQSHPNLVASLEPLAASLAAAWTREAWRLGGCRLILAEGRCAVGQQPRRGEMVTGERRRRGASQLVSLQCQTQKYLGG